MSSEMRTKAIARLVKESKPHLLIKAYMRVFKKRRGYELESVVKEAISNYKKPIDAILECDSQKNINEYLLKQIDDLKLPVVIKGGTVIQTYWENNRKTLDIDSHSVEEKIEGIIERLTNSKNAIRFKSCMLIHRNGIVGEKDIKLAQEFVEFAKAYPNKIIELQYIIESDVLGAKEKDKYRTLDISKFVSGDKYNYILDVAKESFVVEGVMNVFLDAKTIFINAVMGFTPHFNEGTIALDTLIDENTEAVKLYGGGDTMQELKRLLPGLYIMALDSPKYYIFTGGGAVLKAIEQGSHFGIAPIEELAKRKGDK